MPPFPSQMQPPLMMPTPPLSPPSQPASSSSDSQVSFSLVVFNGTQLDLSNFLRQFPQCSAQDYFYQVHLSAASRST
jgi:hypothetical protein